MVAVEDRRGAARRTAPLVKDSRLESLTRT